MAKKRKKKSASKAKALILKMRLFPMYWKVIITIIVAIGGWTGGTTLFFMGDNFAMCSGIVVLALLGWVLINMWMPKKIEDEEQ